MTDSFFASILSFAQGIQNLLDMIETFLTLLLVAHPLELKEKIQQLESSPDTIEGGHFMQLSEAYLEDQKWDKAMVYFLKGLKKSPPVKSDPPSKELQEALSIYLEPATGDELRKKSSWLIETYQGKTCDPRIDYLLAASYANLGNYKEFMHRFHAAYEKDPAFFLADKIQAVIYTKLFDREVDRAKKEEYRQQAFTCCLRAIQGVQGDLTLYRMAIDFAPEGHEKEIVRVTLERIMQEKIMVPRNEIRYWVAKAVETDQKNLARKFLDIATTWYSYSQSIEKAKDLVDQGK